MFYPIDYSNRAAQLPRILAEDTGAPELRTPMLHTRRSRRLSLPKRLPKQQTALHTCGTPRLCTAGAK